jgi:hypothetical protein
MNRPWWTEDNKVDFIAEGFKCCLRRGPLGSWCGYVGVPASHPWHGKSYNDYIKPTADMLGPRDANDHGPIDLLCMALSDKDPSEELSIGLAMRVHGGITYTADHKPYGKPEGLWWFGFDCAHAGDLVPSFAERQCGCHTGDIYRDQSYVVAEVQSLAAQLAKVQ